MREIPESVFRWLHVSDFHFGTEESAEGFLADDIVQLVAKRAANGKPIHAIFATGDFAYHGREDEFVAFNTRFIDALNEVMEGDPTDWLYAVPGNHDVFRGDSKLTKADLYEAQTKFGQILHPSPAGLACREVELLPRFSAFTDSDQSTRNTTGLGGERGYFSDRIEVGGSKLGIVGLNTAWLSMSKEDAGLLTPGKLMVRRGLEEVQDCDFVFVLGHHPIDCFVEGPKSERSAISRLFAIHRTIYLHGHYHKSGGDRHGLGGQFLAYQSGAAFMPSKHPSASDYVQGLLIGELNMTSELICIEPLHWVDGSQAWLYDSIAFPPETRKSGTDQHCFGIPEGTENARPEEKRDHETDGSYRADHDSMLRTYLENNPDEATNRLAQTLMNGGSATDPVVDPSGEPCIDCLCTVIAQNGQTIAIMPSSGSKPDIEGVGRTGVALDLLNLSIPYAKYFFVSDEELEAMDHLLIENKGRSRYHLVASDVAYLCPNAGRLQAIATRGERLSFLWDVARHIYRSTSVNYKTGDHRTHRHRQNLLFNRLRLEDCRNSFANINQAHTLTKVIIINSQRNRPAAKRSSLSKLEGEEAKRALLDGIESRILHGSKFWDTARSDDSEAAVQIVNALDMDQLEVHRLDVSHPEQRLPEHVLREMADLIRGKSIHDPMKKVEVGTDLDLRHHNDALLRAIGAVDRLWFLGVSGESLFKDISLWQLLGRRDEPIEIRFLLLDPYSEAAEVWAKRVYHDKPDGFLQDEIETNIQAIAGFRREFAQLTEGMGSLEVKLYRTMPKMRLTFIGTERLILSDYTDSTRTNYSTSVFTDLHRDHLLPVHKVITGLYESMWERQDSNLVVPSASQE